jgi:hypothetical protein
MGHQAVVAAASPKGQMKPVNLAAAETELACLKLALARVKEDRDELRQERDNRRREAETLCAEKQIVAKLRKADERLEAIAAAKLLSWRRGLRLIG